ncbi:MAG: carboxypeptidase-like regulatory domain-containing protein, partial [Bacteroidetes bacterium]|nr:carboxypeptidase-like regulatory domain-containing protein [Bacteroidota bacterium]
MRQVTGQQRAVTGQVLDENRQPIPGVNILLKGTSVGTITDVNGNYSLMVDHNDGELVFSFVGMDTQEVFIGQKAVINIGMHQGSKPLDEVVVTAIGEKVDKDKFGSSVSTVNGFNIQRSGETGTLQGLAGKAAGVLITRNGGDPGSGAYIQIRGQNTLSGNAQPLFIVDGIPVSNSSEFGNIERIAQSRVNDLNPDDIASVEVLKGAAAAAIWGTRAANGVVIISTKKGNSNQGKINISFQSTFSVDAVNKMPLLQRAYGQGLNGWWAQDKAVSWGDKKAGRTGTNDIFITNP